MALGALSLLRSLLDPIFSLLRVRLFGVGVNNLSRLRLTRALSRCGAFQQPFSCGALTVAACTCAESLHLNSSQDSDQIYWI